MWLEDAVTDVNIKRKKNSFLVKEQDLCRSQLKFSCPIGLPSQPDFCWVSPSSGKHRALTTVALVKGLSASALAEHPGGQRALMWSVMEGKASENLASLNRVESEHPPGREAGELLFCSPFLQDSICSRTASPELDRAQCPLFSLVHDSPGLPGEGGDIEHYLSFRTFRREVYSYIKKKKKKDNIAKMVPSSFK